MSISTYLYLQVIKLEELREKKLQKLLGSTGDQRIL